MRKKAIRVGITLAASLAAYAVYALVALPLIEPRVTRIEGPSGSDWDNIPRPTQAYEKLLSHFFPSGSWVMRNPKLLESDQGILLIKEYDAVGAKSIRLAPFAMILFPSNAVREDPNRIGEAVVFESPEAVLEFDRPLDLSRAKIGHLKGGRLAGDVTIRSDQKLPGAADDLLITTRDITLGETTIETHEAVKFRLGENVGSGRLLRIHLAPRDQSRSQGMNLGGIQSMELVYDVKMHFQMAGKGLLPAGALGGARTITAARPYTSALVATSLAAGAAKSSAAGEPPIEITSKGPFRFDFNRQEASFERQVDMLRLNPVGESDQMNCDRLAIDFAPREVEATGQTPPSLSSGANAKTAPSNEVKSRSRMPKLEVRLMRASGHPVIIRSPSTGAAARCEKLEYDLKTGRVSLEDAARVMLRDTRNEVSAPKVSFQPGVRGGLPSFEAVGPGWLEGATEDSPNQRFRAAWRREARLRPYEGQHLLSVLGAAELSYDGVGSLAAEEIWLWMHQSDAAKAVTTARPSKPADRASAGDVGKIAARVTPDRMLANGGVKIRSPQLNGDPGRFEVWFQAAAPAGGAANLETVDAEPSEKAGDDRTRDGGLAQRGPLGRRGNSGSTFEVGGKLLRLNVMWGDRPAVEDVELIGGATFVETATENPEEKPLDVRGEEVRIAKASSPRSLATIVGRPAMVAARGLVMSAAQINVDRGANRIWIDGPGKMTLPIDRDLHGQPLDRPQTAAIAWEKGMNFDGQTIRYEQQVEVVGQYQRLTTAMLQARLLDAIDFSAPPKSSQNTKVSTLLCQGGVALENRTFNGADQVAFDIVEAKDLAIDQMTGAIVAHGPGSIRSHRRGLKDGASDRASPLAFGAGNVRPIAAENPPTNPAANSAASVASRMTYLEAHFQREASGNLNDRTLTLYDQIHCVYGPVDDWQRTIVVDVANQLPEGVVTLKSDRLTVSQPPGDGANRSRPAIELAAEGNTLVEGATFTARAERMTYTEAKDLLILEGTGRADAILTRQTKVGGPTTRAAARKVMFWRATNTVEVDDAKSLNLSNLPPIDRSRLRR